MTVATNPLTGSFWLPTRDGDPRVRALYLRHYSSKRSRPYRTGSPLFVAAGQKYVLVNTEATAAFIWLRNTVERLDKQQGVICTLFRNESEARSSDLIREACALAWARWPGERLFTYVDPREIRSTNPGYCFLAAGWRRCPERSGRGLVILECEPEWTE